MEDKEDKEELRNKQELTTLPTPQGTSHFSRALLLVVRQRGDAADVMAYTLQICYEESLMTSSDRVHKRGVVLGKVSRKLFRMLNRMSAVSSTFSHQRQDINGEHLKKQI